MHCKPVICFLWITYCPNIFAGCDKQWELNQSFYLPRKLSVCTSSLPHYYNTTLFIQSVTYLCISASIIIFIQNALIHEISGPVTNSPHLFYVGTYVSISLTFITHFIELYIIKSAISKFRRANEITRLPMFIFLCKLIFT